MAKDTSKDFARSVAALSPAKRELLLLRLKQSGQSAKTERINPESKFGSSRPLSFAQERIWLFEQLEPGTPAYIITFALRLTGRLDMRALALSCDEIARRHELLRASFHTVDAKPRLVISDQASFAIELVDLSELSPDEAEQEAIKLCFEQSRQPFDLERSGLARLNLLRLSAKDHIAVLTMHHIISDMWSVGLFMKEMALLYKSFLNGAPSPLEELPIQYGDYAYWEREHLQGERIESQLRYWKAQLDGGSTVLRLVTDHPRPKVQTLNGARETVLIDTDTVERLNALRSQEGATMFMALLAAYNALLHRYTGQADILIGTPIANRTRSETSNLIGLFLNVLVIRTDLSGARTFRELLRRVSKTTLEAFDNQELSFDKVIEALKVERDPSRHPLFQAFFVFMKNPAKTFEVPGLSASRFKINNGISKYDIELSIEETADGLAATMIYNRDLFAATTIARMLEHYNRLLKLVAEEPDSPLLDIQLEDDAEEGRDLASSTFQNADEFVFEL